MASKKSTSVSASRVSELNNGEESRTLAECLAVNQAKLVESVLSPLLPPSEVAQVVAAALKVSSQGITRQLPAIGSALSLVNPHITQKLSAHRSDTVRAWALFACVNEPSLSLNSALEICLTYARDTHFGVREWAWIAVRPRIVASVRDAIRILESRVSDHCAYIRRFCVESTRPRGVWAQHINELKTHPELGEGLLRPLAMEREKYVQDSVANWINDASKSRPDWARNFCRELTSISPNPSIEQLTQRALRSIS